MKIPNKVKIQGRTYKVQIQKETDIVSNDCGKSLRNKGLIAIDADLIQGEKEITFFHEVIHLLNGELKETECEWMAGAIYGFLKDNNLIT